VKRFPDWQVRFGAFLQGRRRAPFAWGSNDCALFAADAVEAITGEHLCPQLRGHRDAREALRLLAREGGVRGIAMQALGEPIRPVFARVGDVVVVLTGKREAMALCNGQTALLPGPRGLVAVSMKTALVAWRVG
jgi:hypothetical protein